MDIDYAERKAQMELQRYKERMSLEQIGQFHGISRERVRQILGNVGPQNGGFYYSKYLNTLRNRRWMDAHRGLSNQEITELAGASPNIVSRPDYYHPVSGEWTWARSAQWTEWASAHLAELGYPNRLMPLHCPYEIELDSGLRVVVRVACKTCQTSPFSKSPQYHFRLHRKAESRRQTDAYLFILAETEEVFVVPDCQIPPNKNEIYFCWPSGRPKMGKYQQYKDRYDLLNGKGR